MVLWEITLGTAYFLGLRRTYRLALKIQRRLIKPNHPKIHQFVHRRVRAVFDMVLKVHQNIQQRDIEVGRNLGNRILRWLDRMKPSAQIRAPPSEKLPNSTSSTGMTKPNSNNQKARSNFQRSSEREYDRHLFSSQSRIWTRTFPTISRIMCPPWTGIQYRNSSSWRPSGNVFTPNFANFGSEGVIRRDIMQWMLLD